MPAAHAASDHSQLVPSPAQVSPRSPDAEASTGRGSPDLFAHRISAVFLLHQAEQTEMKGTAAELTRLCGESIIMHALSASESKDFSKYFAHVKDT